eukprot:2773225-Pleurochrysis_carterae.AAC.3
MIDQEGLEILRAYRHRSYIAVPHYGCRAHGLGDAAPCWRRRHTCGSYGEGARSSYACDTE